jgi:membrane protein implicated in regulation of membrane protease activity
MTWTPPAVWSVIGLALLALEAAAPGLVVIFFGLGALTTALAALLFSIDLPAQLLVFAVSSVACLLTLRGGVKRVFQGRVGAKDEAVTRIDSFLGETATVTEAIPAGGRGRIKARGSFYAASAGEALAPGETVAIVEDVNGDHTLFKVEKAR